MSDTPRTDVKVVAPRLMWACYEINGTVHFFEEEYQTLGCGVLHKPHACAIVANGIPVSCVPLNDIKSLRLCAYQAWWKAREQGLSAKQQIDAALAAVGIKKPRVKQSHRRTAIDAARKDAKP